MPDRKEGNLGRTVAFIPVRGGSKSIPLKNIKELKGKPLVYWTIKAASECDFIDRVYVSTDSLKIRKCVEELGVSKVEVIDRSEETASDTASTESAMLEFANNIKDWDNIILIQATSPLLRTDDLKKGYELYLSKDTDSVFSGVRKKQFLWYDEGDHVSPSYDPLKRPRRQEYKGYIVENGAFYITDRERLLRSGCRISGRIRVCEMSEASIYEIDEEEDFTVIEAVMEKRQFRA
ncbi:MAG: acylneuraminate cytidylyltransferase family protein, partial [Lachnospiraceae bacterium]|nr:acylneuraminate cytidylyltransferase family protein [Lachnospiraceae bacterium]